MWVCLGLDVEFKFSSERDNRGICTNLMRGGGAFHTVGATKAKL